MPGHHKAVVAIMCGLFLAGCQTDTIKPSPDTSAQVAPTTLPDRWRQALNQPATKTRKPQQAEATDLWQVTREHLTLEPDANNERIDRQLQWFLRHHRYMEHASERARFYYYYVLSSVLERDLPAELALLPFVESSFNPFAESPSRASGPWQFIPSTADLFGLKSTWWYDGRRDIIESTQAALDYLTYLNKRFDGDWLLSLAAYNCGEGCVARAVKKNRQSGQPSDYWHLDLPRETQRYVPKILAVARYIRQAESLEVALPTIPNEPYFEVVSIKGQIELAKAAQLAQVDLDLLKQLNPGFNQWATDPAGPHRLLLPTDATEPFRLALSELPASERVSWARYTIRRGDTLSAIASRFGTNVAALRTSNNLGSNRIRAGRTLLIPAGAKARQSVDQQEERRVHRVASGDNLWSIARRYGVSTEQLADWNGITDVRALRPGQDLVLYP
ncbi:LysM peptidoglycan-binding domain-containing protein [Marinobacterium litorale]|uniref:LysM peptidoglycan-binding domain-containing protein n=1 Tax=Marinobacterium litorale TaxID=404770 RepID=UPI0004170672|nr:LysM peptidoglycan-binding domain-containing protein [Marinobacterium litorale]